MLKNFLLEPEEYTKFSFTFLIGKFFLYFVKILLFKFCKMT